MLVAANRDRLDQFVARHGRRPRVLHIGNIANNAYNNAKLLNRAGFDCDVLCHDYYHVMGCPEWEDADFKGDPGDDFAPQWSQVELGGFQRPRWFAQGPLHIATRYLAARFDGRNARAERLWRAMEGHNGLAPRRRLAAIRRLAFAGQRLANALLSTSTLFGRVERRFARLAEGHVLSRLGFLGITIGVAVASAVVQLLYLPLGVVREPIRQRMRVLATALNEAFPDRGDRLEVADAVHYELRVAPMRRLLARYDIVQAYSTDPIWPMLCGRPYFALEHGTLRTIPFQPDPVGRLTALAYHLAEHVFVTNYDCLQNARLLAGDRITFINHPFDERHGDSIAGSESVRAELLAELDSEFLFFHPTRHDWVPGAGFADKANDVFLRAFAELRRRGLRVGLVCCAWGANVAQSRQLVAASGCEQHVRWTAPMGTVRFERTALASDCVVDQFKLGAFGGVMFKAVAVGRPVCTYLDETALAARYAESPPVVNCRSERDIVQAMSRLITEPRTLADVGRRAQQWMRTHHASTQTVNLQATRYLDYLQGSPACVSA